jgi:hypothetical protein
MKNLTVIALVVLSLGGVPRPSHACSNFYFDKNGYSLIAHNMEWVTGGGMVVINKRHVQKRGFQVKDTGSGARGATRRVWSHCCFAWEWWLGAAADLRLITELVEAEVGSLRFAAAGGKAAGEQREIDGPQAAREVAGIEAGARREVLDLGGERVHG